MRRRRSTATPAATTPASVARPRIFQRRICVQYGGAERGDHPRRRGHRRRRDRRRVAVPWPQRRRQGDPHVHERARQPRGDGRGHRRPAPAAVAHGDGPDARGRVDRDASPRRPAQPARRGVRGVDREVRPAGVGPPVPRRRHEGDGGRAAARRRDVRQQAVPEGRPARPLVGGRPRPQGGDRRGRRTAPSCWRSRSAAWGCSTRRSRPTGTTRARSGAATASSSPTGRRSAASSASWTSEGRATRSLLPRPSVAEEALEAGGCSVVATRSRNWARDRRRFETIRAQKRVCDESRPDCDGATAGLVGGSGPTPLQELFAHPGPHEAGPRRQATGVHTRWVHSSSGMPRSSKRLRICSIIST